MLSEVEKTLQEYPNAKLAGYLEVRGIGKVPIFTGIPVPEFVETRGRKKLDESHLIQQYVQGRVNGIYKNHSDGARKLAHKADNQYTGFDTHVDRLRRLFGRAWSQYGLSLNDAP